MIKVRVQLDGNQFGYVTYICKQTMEWYKDVLALIDDNVTLIALTEANTGALITIPIKRYIVEVSEIVE